MIMQLWASQAPWETAGVKHAAEGALTLLLLSSQITAYISVKCGDIL